MDRQEKTSVFQAGAMSAWKEFAFRLPGLPPAAKCFLKDAIGLTGMEVSLNALRVGEAIPFLHRHHRNEELYLFLSGEGEFLADDQRIPITAGTCIRCAPEVERSWRNTAEAELLFVVIQAPAGTMPTSSVQDGELVKGRPDWE